MELFSALIGFGLLVAMFVIPFTIIFVVYGLILKSIDSGLIYSWLRCIAWLVDPEVRALGKYEKKRAEEWERTKARLRANRNFDWKAEAVRRGLKSSQKS